MSALKISSQSKFNIFAIIIIVLVGLSIFVSLLFLCHPIQTQGDHLKAIENYKRSIAFSPDFADSHYNIALSYDEIGGYDNAIRHYKKALDLDYAKEEIYGNLAAIYLKLGRIEKALDYGNKTLEIQNDYAEAYATLGGCYYFLREFEKARSYLNKAIDLYKEQGKEEKIESAKSILKIVPAVGVLKKAK